MVVKCVHWSNFILKVPRINCQIISLNFIWTLCVVVANKSKKKYLENCQIVWKTWIYTKCVGSQARAANMQEESTAIKQMEPIAIFGFDGHVPQGLKGNMWCEDLFSLHISVSSSRFHCSTSWWRSCLVSTWQQSCNLEFSNRQTGLSLRTHSYSFVPEHFQQWQLRCIRPSEPHGVSSVCDCLGLGDKNWSFASWIA